MLDSLPLQCIFEDFVEGILIRSNVFLISVCLQ